MTAKIRAATKRHVCRCICGWWMTFRWVPWVLWLECENPACRRLFPKGPSFSLWFSRN